MMADPVSAVRARSAQKTFLLIHGLFCGGWVWRRVADLLENGGHKVYSPTLTGLGERSHLLSKHIDLDTHIADVVNVIKWEGLQDVCLVAHSYAGWICSGALEQIGDQVSSIVWLDAFKPEDGQKPIDLAYEGFRTAFQNAAERGDACFPPPEGLPPTFINAGDQAFVNSKLTPHPIGTYSQAIRLTGRREMVAKKTYIRIPRLPQPVLDKALADCKADKTWTTIELNNSGHMAMLDVPEELANLIVEAF